MVLSFADDAGFLYVWVVAVWLAGGTLHMTSQNIPHALAFVLWSVPASWELGESWRDYSSPSDD